MGAEVELNDEAFGGFMISKNVYAGRPIRYSYRERSEIPALNGWTVYSVDDDDDYVSDPLNFTIVGATTMSEIEPMMLELFDAPYGTDLCWLYENGKLAGFYDLVADKKTTLRKILKYPQRYE